MTTIDFNSELKRRIERHAADRYGLELQHDGNTGYRLLDIVLGRPDYPVDGSYTSLSRLNDYLGKRDKALKAGEWAGPNDDAPA